MRRPKYRNTKVEVDGITFDSKLESEEWLKLKMLERAGHISNLRRQVKYDLYVNGEKVCAYIADFVYDEAGEEIVLDVKSAFTAKLPEFRLKAKLFKAIHGKDIMLSDGLPATARRPSVRKRPA